MADTYTPNLNLTKVERGKLDWDDEEHANLVILDTAVGTGHKTDGDHKDDIIKDKHIDWGSGANQVDLDDVPDGTIYRRNKIALQLTAGEDIAQYDVVYLSANDTVKKADADAEATAKVMALALAAVSNGNSGYFLIIGDITNVGWAWTAGANLYLSTTAGVITATPPSGSGDIVIRLGFAINATKIFFNPSPEYLEV